MPVNYLNLAEIDNAVNQNQMAGLQRETMMANLLKQKKMDAEDDAYKNAFKGSIGADGNLDQQGLLQRLISANQGDKAYEMKNKFDTQALAKQKAEQEHQSAVLGHAIKAADYTADVFSKVAPDGSNYQQARQHLIDNGLAKETDLSPEYNPQEVQAHIMDAKSFREQNKPKTQKIGFTPNGIAYDENNPQGITLGTKYAKPNESQDNRAPVAVIDPTTGKPKYVRPSDSYGMTPAKDGMSEGYSTKPLPTTALKLQNETLDKLSIANNNNLKLSEIQTKIEGGQLDLGLFSNLAGKALNYTGNSTESSRNLDSFKSSIEKLRNDSLRLNNGVQTDGDAQRAWNELFENINDKDVVLQRLKEIQDINSRGADLQKLQVENIRSNYNAEPVDFSKYEAKPTTAAKGKYIETRTLPDGRKVGKTKDGKIEVIK
jgi:hypothetical protein